MTSSRIFRLLTIDLDDTLWPCMPVIRRAEKEMHAWLRGMAPGLTDVYALEAMVQHRRELAAKRPDISHDITAVRIESLRDLLLEFGYEPDLAREAMAVFLEHRNRVEPYADVIPALQALRTSHRLVSLTNGNADVPSTPLRGLFHHSLRASEVGAQRPHPALFHKALALDGTEPRYALHLGDDPYRDVEAARRVGIESVWVNRSRAAWPSELQPPVAEVADLTALRRWLQGD